jgi:hypothetical protein
MSVPVEVDSIHNRYWLLNRNSNKSSEDLTETYKLNLYILITGRLRNYYMIQGTSAPLLSLSFPIDVNYLEVKAN